jgi:hypothetical protein
MTERSIEIAGVKAVQRHEHDGLLPGLRREQLRRTGYVAKLEEPGDANQPPHRFVMAAKAGRIHPHECRAGWKMLRMWELVYEKPLPRFATPLRSDSVRVTTGSGRVTTAKGCPKGGLQPTNQTLDGTGIQLHVESEPTCV